VLTVHVESVDRQRTGEIGKSGRNYFLTLLLAQSAGKLLSLVEPVRRVVRGLDPEGAGGDVRTMQDLYHDNAIGNSRDRARVAAMGVMGVTLAFVELYGLVADAVRRRTRETASAWLWARALRYQ
jgi:hypothetical protein